MISPELVVVDVRVSAVPNVTLLDALLVTASPSTGTVGLKSDSSRGLFNVDFTM